LSRIPSNVSFTDAIAEMTGEVDVEQSAIKYGEQLDSALLYREIEVNYVSESEDDYSISDVSSLGSNGNLEWEVITPFQPGQLRILPPPRRRNCANG
jgi:hypothetical protein